MLIPIGVYVPTDGRPWANYTVLGLTVALSCAALGWIRPTEDEQTLLQVLRLQK